jgi:hypothetical protein
MYLDKCVRSMKIRNILDFKIVNFRIRIYEAITMIYKIDIDAITEAERI